MRGIQYLQTLCDQRNVQGLVVGVPLDDQGQLTDQAHTAGVMDDDLPEIFLWPL